MNVEKLRDSVRNVPDFPIPGIQFKDVTTLFIDPKILDELSEGLVEMYKDKGVSKVVGIESRGFIMGPMLARDLNAGFVPIRKPGKLPAETYEISYMKEYGSDTIQIHRDAINENDIVVLHDDLLATGGTMLAAVQLIKKFNPKKIYVNFLIELEELNGRKLFDPDIEVEAIIKYAV
ncbi:MAG: adenine phosphoribosyltransferase [Candidatus Symbiothrix sp.]|jgi:adenine phosphoribosyltransferase|nr:adenine phosphoribosyltransferase [Candidatus Symbiothrix sp.]